MFLCKELTELHCPVIGRQFVDYSTAMYSVDKILKFP